MSTAHHSTSSTQGNGAHAEDWNSEEYVAGWREREKDRAPERRRQFAIIRAMFPKRPADEFRYLNLGAGAGALDEVLLEAFPGASATLIDGSLPMLGAAQRQLARFGSRVEYVHADLASPDWAGAVSAPFDFTVSTFALHHLRDAIRVRELYGEVYRLMGHGGMLMNLDHIRAARPSLAALGPWAARDADAALYGHGGHAHIPGTLVEHMAWLSEAGFAGVDVLWKEMHLALFTGIRDHIHMPDDAGGHGHAAAH